MPGQAEGRGHIRAPVSAPKQLPPVPNLGELKEALSVWALKLEKRERVFSESKMQRSEVLFHLRSISFVDM